MESSRKPRILIVDDDREAADLLAEAMALMGYDATVAYTGKAALSLAPEYIPDVVVIDLIMPFIDGFTVAAELRGSDPRTSIGLIALTASDDAMSKDRALASGFNRFIVKPASLSAIVDAINDHLAYSPI
jgi:DNA-binding response OmpR family regulator